MVSITVVFISTPNLGEDSHFDEHIFQRGWFNHQLDYLFWRYQTLQMYGN